VCVRVKKDECLPASLCVRRRLLLALIRVVPSAGDDNAASVRHAPCLSLSFSETHHRPSPRRGRGLPLLLLLLVPLLLVPLLLVPLLLPLLVPPLLARRQQQRPRLVRQRRHALGKRRARLGAPEQRPVAPVGQQARLALQAREAGVGVAQALGQGGGRAAELGAPGGVVARRRRLPRQQRVLREDLLLEGGRLGVDVLDGLGCGLRWVWVVGLAVFCRVGAAAGA
jgi:hypothetical protein